MGFTRGERVRFTERYVPLRLPGGSPLTVAEAGYETEVVDAAPGSQAVGLRAPYVASKRALLGPDCLQFVPASVLEPA